MVFGWARAARWDRRAVRRDDEEGGEDINLCRIYSKLGFFSLDFCFCWRVSRRGDEVLRLREIVM